MGTIVETRCGKLEGRETQGVQVFRGIPYARPPVGILRFRAPEPAQPWSGVRSALEFGPSNVLFVGDSEGAAVYALEVKPPASSGSGKIDTIEDLSSCTLLIVRRTSHWTPRTST